MRFIHLCHSPALQLCGYCLYFPLRSYPSALHIGHIMLLLSQKYSFTSGTQNSCSFKHPHCISAIFIGQSSLIFLFPSYFPFFPSFFISYFLFLPSLLFPFNIFFIPFPISFFSFLTLLSLFPLSL